MTISKPSQESIIKDTHRGLWYVDGKLVRVLEAGLSDLLHDRWIASHPEHRLEINRQGGTPVGLEAALCGVEASPAFPRPARLPVPPRSPAIAPQPLPAAAARAGVQLAGRSRFYTNPVRALPAPQKGHKSTESQ